MQRSFVKNALRPYVLAARRWRRGDLRLADLAWGHASFSQFGEDRVLEQLFEGRSTGFYVDVGAYDPFHASNTCLLYRRGWRGINLEPDPHAKALIELHRPRDTTLPYAVSDVEGPVVFLLKGSFSGIADARHQWGTDGEPVTVESRRLSTILDEHVPPGIAVDLLDVDCEGHDLDVLRSNDWERWRPAVILAEWHEGVDVSKYLVSAGYELYVRLGPTGIFVAR